VQCGAQEHSEKNVREKHTEAKKHIEKRSMRKVKRNDKKGKNNNRLPPIHHLLT
jgi:hypothetical protein